jgi:hypothetical protein
MTVRYTNVRTYERGVKRDNGQGWNCLHCGTPATVKATRNDGRFKMDVVACDRHALEGGLTK